MVLPPEQIALLNEIVDRVACRDRVYEDWGFREKTNLGLGINVLFAGASGTGKTLAAEVIANALELDLFSIDLSAVVSKYIGETEKNLRRLFKAAESRDVILLFDEADALFGKRSKVAVSQRVGRWAAIIDTVKLSEICARNMGHCPFVVTHTDIDRWFPKVGGDQLAMNISHMDQGDVSIRVKFQQLVLR